MTDLLPTLARAVRRIWLLVAFVVGLLPVAAVDRLERRSSFAGPDRDAESYWIDRQGRTGPVVRSTPRMLVPVPPGSPAAGYLRTTRTFSRRRALSTAWCLVVLAPLRLGRDDTDPYLDPAIYPMY